NALCCRLLPSGICLSGVSGKERIFLAGMALCRSVGSYRMDILGVCVSRRSRGVSRMQRRQALESDDAGYRDDLLYCVVVRGACVLVADLAILGEADATVGQNAG